MLKRSKKKLSGSTLSKHQSHLNAHVDYGDVCIVKRVQNGRLAKVQLLKRHVLVVYLHAEKKNIIDMIVLYT